MKKIKKLLSIILCLTLLPSFGIEAFATENEGNETTNALFDSVKGEAEETADIVKELLEERTESSKTFLLDDGTKMYAQYEQPIHFKAENNAWVEYDNTLDDKLENKSSNIKVSLSDKAKNEDMISITADNHTISWGYKDIEACVATRIASIKSISGNSKFTTLNKNTSETIYQNVYKDVNLEYFVTSEGVKENIVLNSAEVQNEFFIKYNIGNLIAKQINDYAITLYDNKENEVYSITAPYMTDEKGVLSDKLKLNIEKNEKGKLEVKLTADSSFIKNSARSFPIKIDPEISTTAISSHFIFSEANNSGTFINHGPYYVNNSDLFAGKVTSLQSLEEGERIISAKYTLEVNNSSTLFSDEEENAIVINAHKIDSYNNNTVSYYSDIEDYDTLTYSDNEDVTFDLTNIYKEWYNNPDDPKGFVLEAHNTASSKQVVFKEHITKPILTVIYKDFTGTESSLSYHSVDCGHNATASVSDYLGNLVINQPLYEGTGSRMPVTLSATYNSINYDSAFGNGSPSGFGWQFSFNQYVREADSTMQSAGYDYIYQDSDGTDHYLKSSGDNEWYDEDGLGITLKVNESNITIDNGNTQTYELPSAGGKLLSEKDEYDNTITYSYSNGNITSLTDGAGRTFTFNYANNSNGESRVRYIRLPNNKTISFYYTSNEKDKFNYIYFPDGRVTKFEYNNDNRITSIQQVYQSTTPHTNGLKYSFSYNSIGQVTKITEYGSDNTEGDYLDIEYGTDNTTTYTDKYDNTLTYTFDNNGYKISTLNSNGYVDNDSSSGLRITGGSNDFIKNYIAQSIEQNGNYYTKFDGSLNGVNSSGGTMTFDDSIEENNQFLGNTSIRIYNRKNTSAFYTGAYHCFDEDFNGKDITFSAYIKTRSIIESYSNDATGAVLSITYTCEGENIEKNSIGYKGSNGWQRLSVSAFIPNGATNLKICCSVRYASGTAWFDCLQLEEGNCVNDFNALQNCDFSNTNNWETSTNSNVTFDDNSVTLQGLAGAYNNVKKNIDVEETTITETEPATYVIEEDEPSSFGNIYTYDQFGNKTKAEQGQIIRRVKKTYLVNPIEIPTGDLNNTPEPSQTQNNNTITNTLGNKYIYQIVPVNRSNIIFNIVGKAQAKSVPLTNKCRTFGIALNIYYSGEISPETHYKEFNNFTDTIQTVELSVCPNHSEKVIDSVAFSFVYSYNVNTMTAYNAMLNIASTAVNVIDENEQEDDEPESEPTITPQESTVEPNTQSTESLDDCLNYEIISESINESQPFMRNSSDYDTNSNNYLVQKTNELGVQCNYTYDDNGNILSSTNRLGNGYNYTYDYAGNITSIFNGSATNQYNYNSAGLLSSVDHNNFSYNFSYDVFNKLISTKINNTPLSQNTYSSNGNLIRSSFANGDFYEYNYDFFNNISLISSESGDVARFIYNKKGSLSLIIDYSSNTSTQYYHDFSGNLTNKSIQCTGDNLSYYVDYKSNGDIVEKTSIGSQTRTIITSKDETGKLIVYNDGVTNLTSTDLFGRTIESHTQKDDLDFNTTYTYTNGTYTNSTTNNIRNLTQTLGETVLSNHEYFYDTNTGYISRINIDNTPSLEYNYDNYNQLSMVKDNTNNLCTQYTYDNSGNILNIKKMIYENSQPGSTISEDTFEYENNGWNDKLLKINNDNIIYDNSGNPVSYRNGMQLSWSNGHKLDSINYNGTSIFFEYDSNGMRTKKNNTRYYYDSENNLIALKKGYSTLFFYYDECGTPNSFSYNGQMYYYIKNLHGDIEKIVNRLGQVVATYAYDAYGKIIYIKNYYGASVVDPMEIGMLNPFRYRSYVFDDETGLYYLQSRYYDPITCRFISPDVTQTLFNKSNVYLSNTYTYCANNPIQYIDNDGKLFIELLFPIIPAIQPLIDTFRISLIVNGTNVVMSLPGILFSVHQLMPMSTEFYLHSFIHREKAKCYNFSDNSSYINKIQNSTSFDRMFISEKFRDMDLISSVYNNSCLNAYLEGITHSCQLNFIRKNINFNPYKNKDYDLALSIGSCSPTVRFIYLGKTRKKNTYKWRLCVEFCDDYDYDLWNDFSRGYLETIANNIPGYLSQKLGLAKEYSWKISFTKDIEYTLKYPIGG